MKKRLSIIISIIVIVGIILGLTLGLIRKNVFTQNVGFEISGLDAYIIYAKGTDVLTGTLDPVASYGETAVSTEITLYKSQAAASKTLYGHIYLDLTSITSQLAAEPALKWVITSNNTVLNQGNFNGKVTNDSIPLKLNIPLTTTEQKFQIYIWLDDSMEINDEIEEQTLSTIVRAEATENEYEIPLDDSGANKPKLVQGLIPVTYYNNNWVKADTEDKNGTYKWYDYDDKRWANAVLVSETGTSHNRSYYESADAGEVIPESDVLAYYVWIPRYKYKVWNINKVGQAESNYGYNAYTEGIDIVFESGTATTGTITCNSYSFAAPNSTTPNETCSGANNAYYTHPAFWWDIDGDGAHDTGEELEGIWVGKFEISSETPTASNGGGTSTTLTVRTKPNVNSWRFNPLTNFYKVIYDMQTSNNIYGLSTDRNNTDSHMLKNMEWGAVAYLTNSDYGRCSNKSCTEVTINSNSNFYTGGNAYTTNVNQSTTGNIYGVYDMSGGAAEYVMGNKSSEAGSYTYYASGGGSNFTYSASTARYIDRYANGSTYNDQTAFNRARLGDATGEVTLTTGKTSSWYSDYSYFVGSSVSWFLRGGYYDEGSDAGPFYFNMYTGSSIGGYSARAALIGL